MNSYGFSGEIISWVRSFLVGRSQKVSVNGYESTEKPVISGIPQGSVLGPMLFALYINDLPESVLSHAFLFADDTKMFRIISTPKDSELLQDDLAKVTDWSDKWLVRFNADKCKHMHIGNKKVNAEYFLNHTKLTYAEYEKDIGVVIDDKLNFDKHISDKCKKANCMFALVRRTFRFLDEETFKPLYKAFVRSHLDSCSSVWAPFKSKHIEQIEKVQRHATKQLPGFKDLSYPERLKKLKLPTLSYRRLRGDLIETYKILRNVYDSHTVNFLKLWKDQSARSSLRMNHSLALFPQQTKLDIRKYSFSVRSVKSWNNLPESVVMAPSVNCFKSRLDNFYKNKAIVYDDFKWTGND